MSECQAKLVEDNDIGKQADLPGDEVPEFWYHNQEGFSWGVTHLASDGRGIQNRALEEEWNGQVGSGRQVALKVCWP